MPDETPSPPINRELTTYIVAAYVRRNQIEADQLPVLISTVHLALVGLGKPAAETEVERTPAVTIRQSVHRDYVVCLDLWLAQPDAQTPSRDRPWIERRAVPRAVGPPP